MKGAFFHTQLRFFMAKVPKIQCSTILRMAFSARIMFMNCDKLVGGKGTAYNDANAKDKTYAHIDGGTSNPGYFTKKPDRGDVNGDGTVEISDVAALIDLLLGGGNISNPAADCNQDSSDKISDVLALINYLLNGTW